MHGWIWRVNLLPIVEIIADLVRCRVDERGLTDGVEDSDADNDRWFTLTLDGQPRADMKFAGTDDQVLVDVELDGTDESFEIRVALLLDVCSRYRFALGPAAAAIE